MSDKNTNFKYVNYKWSDEFADKLDPVERLVYRSNILGDDQRITNTGGGNTSSKITMKDPLTGEDVEVLWVKGSGGDLRTSKKENFASLYQDSLFRLQKIYNNAENKDVKTEIEDKMVEMYKHTVFNLNPRASSIDTPLHSFIPFKHVDHMHPDSVIAIAAAKNSEKITKEIFGDEIRWVKWQRPGFDLGLILQEECKKNPDLRGLVLGQHGLINWANDDKECYELTLSIIEKAAEYIEAHNKGEQTFGGQKYQSLPEGKRFEVLSKILPKLRGMISQKNKFIGTIQSDERILRFVNSNDAERLAELGTSCPDHFLRTKIKPLYIDWNPAKENIDSLVKKLEKGLDKYRKDYSAYYEECKHPDSPSIRDANPTVILIPGLGMIAWGKNKSESRVTAEFYNNAVEVMRGAEAIDEYISLPRQEAFDIEYWKLEEAKLKRMPPEKEFAREVVLVIGAGSGIGKAVSHRLAKEGAHIVCADINKDSAEQTAKELIEIYGVGIGISGTGLSNCGPAIGLYVDVTDRKSINEMFKNIILAYGGIDHIIITSGIFVPPDQEGKIPDDKWGLTYDINVTGPYLVADEAKQIWENQGLKGSLTITTSVNAAVSKKGSLAYDTSKAAANHLVRELSIELSPIIRVNGLAPATVVEGSSMFPRERVISSLKKYNISFSEDEDTGLLRNKLSEFYAQRTLLKSPVTLNDQAEAAYLLASKRLSKTTGQIFSVDGGLHEAFLR
ncbi:MAG: short-chain dehydrogenase [Ignavibacteria bacterium GWA2_35_9]|nr:MAG: short-chain dehydrogenase [Ignavibacteria bacterium GWA2_35_9]OGU51496.1 MAG: short-chain dehydrogenase [Ignavibacteria bacterium GWC2_36_12]